jgi:hypothetical protein
MSLIRTVAPSHAGMTPAACSNRAACKAATEARDGGPRQAYAPLSTRQSATSVWPQHPPRRYCRYGKWRRWPSGRRRLSGSVRQRPPGSDFSLNFSVPVGQDCLLDGQPSRQAERQTQRGFGAWTHAEYRSPADIDNPTCKDSSDSPVPSRTTRPVSIGVLPFRRLRVTSRTVRLNLSAWAPPRALFANDIPRCRLPA